MYEINFLPNSYLLLIVIAQIVILSIQCNHVVTFVIVHINCLMCVAVTWDVCIFIGNK